MESALERPELAGLKKYIPGRSIEQVQRDYGLAEVIKLASNENPLGTSAKALAAMHEELAKVHMYPEPTCPDLTRDLSAALSLPEECILFGNGADGILTMIAQAFVNRGDEAITATPTFSIYQQVVTIMGGKIVAVPMGADLKHDLRAMHAAITPRTKLIFVCNPNNPTGTIVRRDEVEWFMERVPSNVVVIFDEAYFDFADDPAYPDSLRYVREGRNVIALRTFSKIAGLAGLRVGYALGAPAMIDALGKVRESFPVNRIAQAGARGALADREFHELTIKTNREGREHLCSQFDRLGMRYAPTQANFIYVEFGVDSAWCFEKLMRLGVVVRPGFIWDMPMWSRVTIGTRSDNEKFVAALEKVLAEKKG